MMVQPRSPHVVFVFGNPDLPADSIPLRLLPRLRRRFPQTDFLVRDPQEEWEETEELTVLDTVQGIKKVAVFRDLKPFIAGPKVTVHDFDALASLQLLQKLGKLKKVRIIGIPSEADESEVLKEVGAILQSI